MSSGSLTSPKKSAANAKNESAKSSASANEWSEKNANERNGSVLIAAKNEKSLLRMTTNESSNEKSSTKEAGAVGLHHAEEEAGRLIACNEATIMTIRLIA
jgi:hypothetical protein